MLCKACCITQSVRFVITSFFRWLMIVQIPAFPCWTGLLAPLQCLGPQCLSQLLPPLQGLAGLLQHLCWTMRGVWSLLLSWMVALNPLLSWMVALNLQSEVRVAAGGTTRRASGQQ